MNKFAEVDCTSELLEVSMLTDFYFVRFHPHLIRGKRLAGRERRAQQFGLTALALRAFKGAHFWRRGALPN